MKRIIIAVFIFLCLLSINTIRVDSLFESSYVLIDRDSNRVLYEKNKDKRFLTASICKIMTAIVAIENGNLFDICQIKDEIYQEGSSLYLRESDEILLIDLIYGLLLRSGNDAAMAIANKVSGNEEKFVVKMNDLAKKIGMINSTFENASGLDNNSYNYSTAYDMALLMSYALDNEIFNEIICTKIYKTTTKMGNYLWSNKHKLVQNTNYVKGGKTGYTNLAKRTLISYAEIDDMRLIAVTFKEPDDYNLHQVLFKKATEEYSYKKIIDSGVYHQIIETLNYYPMVKKGVSLLVKNNSKISVTFFLVDNPDKTCGYLAVYENNKLIYKEDIYPYWPRK